MTMRQTSGKTGGSSDGRASDGMGSALPPDLSKEHPEPPRQPDEPLDRVRAELAALREEVYQSDREIDDLQLRTAKVFHPWYRDTATLVAVAAFLLSLIGAMSSAYRTHQQDIHNARIELTGLIQRLNAIPREQAGMSAETDKRIYVYFEAERRLVAHQAREVMNRIPRHVTTLEYNLVAEELTRSGDLLEAQQMHERARKAAKTYNDETLALRSQAVQAFTLADEETGRRLFQEAIDLGHGKYAGEPAPSVRYNDLGTYHMWAMSELAVGHCEEARKRATAGLALLQKPGAILHRSEVQVWFDTLSKQAAGC